jgi:hypothetical protein
MGLEASENPFDLKTNLKSLDDEQSSLISELRESAGDKDEFLLDEEIGSIEEEDKAESLQPSDQNISSQAIKEESPKAEPSKEEAESLEKRPGNNTVKTTPVEKEEDNKSVKALKITEKSIAEKQKQAEEERLKALEEERIAVQKYEAERLRKKQAKEAAQKKAEKKDAVTAAKEMPKAEKPEEKPAIEIAMEKAKKAVEEPQTKQAATEQKKSKAKSSLDDINLTLEQKELKEEADRLYLEAIKEVDAK